MTAKVFFDICQTVDSTRIYPPRQEKLQSGTIGPGMDSQANLGRIFRSSDRT
jgi:hypothetical protein